MKILNRAFARWIFRDNHPIWSTVLFPLALIGTCAWFGWGSEFSIRVAGFGLSIVGAAVVFRGVLRAQREYNPTPIKQRLLDNLAAGRDSAFGRGKVVVAGTGMSVIASFGRATVALIHGRRNFDVRIAELEKSVERLSQDITKEQESRAHAVDELTKALAAEKSEREVADTRVAARLAEFATSDWKLQLAGGMWLVIGQACTTFPGSISAAIPLRFLTWLR